MGRCVLSLSVFTMILIKLAVSDPYVIGVYHTCANDTNGVTTLHVITDVPAQINAHCRDNFTKTFTSSDDVNFYTNARYAGDSQTECLFIRKATDEVYWLEVRVSWGEPSAVLLKNSHQYILTCTLENQASRESVVQNVGNGLIEREELQQHMGEKSNSTFTLEITDVLGNPFPDASIPIGKTIQLKATIFGNRDEVGLRVTSCCAINEDDIYPIIMGGCGNGVVIPENMGFISDGQQATSPFFNIFQLTSSSNVQFACNFTACQSNCDGDNCVLRRRKRNADYVLKSATEVRSAPVHLRLQQVPDLPIPMFDASKPPSFFNLMPTGRLTTPSALKLAKKYFRHHLENKLKRFIRLVWGIVVAVVCCVVSICIICLMFSTYVIGSTGRILKRVKEILRTRRLKLF